eukprot:444479-Amphidinium_carterae.3
MGNEQYMEQHMEHIVLVDWVSFPLAEDCLGGGMEEMTCDTGLAGPADDDPPWEIDDDTERTSRWTIIDWDVLPHKMKQSIGSSSSTAWRLGCSSIASA